MIKSTVKSKEDKKEKTKYPCIMIANNKMIVLFYKKDGGVVLEMSTIGNSPIGHHSETFDMGNFEPFHGTIELEQE